MSYNTKSAYFCRVTRPKVLKLNFIIYREMAHDDFFLDTLIEFTQWIRGEEKTIAKYNRFGDLSSHLTGNKTNSEIVLQQKNWKILEITRDIRFHGNGRHIKVRLEPIC